MIIIAPLIQFYTQDDDPGVTKRIARKLLHLAFETSNAFWFERDLKVEFPRIEPRVPVFVDTTANAETLDWIRTRGEPWMYNAEEIETGMREGHHFVNVRHDREIIGYAKVAVRRVYINDYLRVVALPDDYAFIYDTYVAPDYRGLKIASFLVLSIMRLFESLGKRRLGCHIPPWNVASINTYVSLGFKKTKYIRFMRIAGCGIFTADPGIT